MSTEGLAGAGARATMGAMQQEPEQPDAPNLALMEWTLCMFAARLRSTGSYSDKQVKAELAERAAALTGMGGDELARSLLAELFDYEYQVSPHGLH